MDFEFTKGEPLTIRCGTFTSPLSVRSASSCYQYHTRDIWCCIDCGGHRRRGGAILACDFHSYTCADQRVGVILFFLLFLRWFCPPPPNRGRRHFSPLYGNPCLPATGVPRLRERHVPRQPRCVRCGGAALLVCVRSPMMRSNMFCHEVRVWCSHTCSALLYVFAVGNESCYLLSPY